jgi:hypothetical protein
MHDVHPKWLSVRRLETVFTCIGYRVRGGPANFEKRRLAGAFVN